MANPADRHILSQALDALSRSPLSEADDGALIRAAHEIWYEHSSLESELRLFLSDCPDEVRVRRAGYLMERMTRFTCLSDERASEALYSLRLLLNSYRSQEQVDRQPGLRLRERRDDLAAIWGLSEGLGLKVQILLPYQTRHYAGTRSTAFK